MAPHSPPGGFVLSPSATPFPQKLVDRVRSGQFIEMRELLIDNISLLKRVASRCPGSTVHRPCHAGSFEASVP